MKERKFNLGDIVSWNGIDGTRAVKVGAEAEVVGYYHNYVIVKWLDEKTNGELNGLYYESDFMLPTPKLEPTIKEETPVMNIQDEIMLLEQVVELGNKLGYETGDLSLTKGIELLKDIKSLFRTNLKKK